jgi:N-acyl-D-amino-acid deacylase
MVASGRSEDDVLSVLTHPLAFMGSDGMALDPDGPAGTVLGHPRSYGAFPRLVGDWVGAGRMTLADAVAACTLRPARRFRIADRGAIRHGAFADVVVFDPDRFRDRATYEDPQRSPEGLEAVIVNGAIAVREDKATGARHGRVFA